MSLRPKIAFAKNTGNQQPSPLCMLPTEIRLMILRRVVVARKHIYLERTSGRPADVQLSILRTCQLLYREGTSLFFTENVFAIVIAPSTIRPGPAPHEDLRNLLNDKHKKRALTNVRKLILTSKQEFRTASSDYSLYSNAFISRLGTCLGMLQGEEVVQDKQITVLFSPSIRNLIYDKKSTEGLKFVGTFELIHCQKFRMHGVHKHPAYKHICQLIEGTSTPLDLPNPARELGRDVGRAREIAKIPINYYDDHRSIVIALDELERAAREVDILAFLKHKLVVDAQTRHFHEKTNENMNQQSHHLLTYLRAEDIEAGKSMLSQEQFTG